MSFAGCQIDLAVKILFIFFHKDAHTFTAPPPIGAGLGDLLRIYDQGHNQSGSPFARPGAGLKTTGMKIVLFTSKSQ